MILASTQPNLYRAFGTAYGPTQKINSGSDRALLLIIRFWKDREWGRSHLRARGLAITAPNASRWFSNRFGHSFLVIVLGRIWSSVLVVV